MTKRFGFSKTEKLKSRKSIDALFNQGAAFTRFPVRVVYRIGPEGPPGVKVGVSATKKNFKKAVDRNRIKRLLREAYRLQKHPLAQAVEGKQLALEVFFLFTGKELPDFASLQPTLHTCLRKLEQTVLTFERPA